MKTSSASASCFVAALSAAAAMTTVLAGETVLSVHGSGTTNPSKCYWAIMEQMAAQTLHPIRLTYRAVGSTTGIAEFVENANNFGSGDLPLTAETYDRVTLDQAQPMVQLPVLLGAVSFFHSVPLGSVDLQGDHLNMTACLLGQVFRRQITTWNDARIRQLNPSMVIVDDLPITVAHRGKGSSSTDSITNYLRLACPDEWPEDMVGPKLDNWPADTEVCEGSAGMTQCLVDIPGAIGYMDAGHGHGAGLQEVALEKQNDDNGDTFYLTSAQASEQGGIAAAEDGVFPASTDMDFSQVSLLNRPGTYTWPIVQMSYLYVRKDLSKVLPDDPAEQALLIAFLQALFGTSPDDDSTFIQQCIDNYGFTRPSEAIVQLARDGVAMLTTSSPANGTVAPTVFTFEKSTTAITGAGDMVISVKRKQIADLERSSLTTKLETVMDEGMPLLQAQLDDAMAEIASLKNQVAAMNAANGGGVPAAPTATNGNLKGTTNNEASASASASSTNGGGGGRLFTEEDEGKLRAALILSSISFVAWVFAMFCLVYRWFTKP